jgi:phosphoglycolate phosphatase-like HAD superfamily hydrolase
MQLRHAGLDDAIDAVVGSDEIAFVKPAPDGIFLACDRLGVDPGRVAYVGDALNDLRCARAAGAVPISAAWGHLFEPDDEPHLIALTPHDLLPLLGRAA